MVILLYFISSLSIGMRKQFNRDNNFIIMIIVNFRILLYTTQTYRHISYKIQNYGLIFYDLKQHKAPGPDLIPKV